MGTDMKYNMEFNRKVNKAEIPTCNILGVDIASINMDWLVGFIHDNIQTKSGNLLAGDYICASNVHTTIMSYEEMDYRMIQNGGILAIPDGGPLSTIGRRRGFYNMSRTTGPSLMERIFEISVANNYRHFFYGSTMPTMGKLYQNLMNRYPGINIVGMYSPPFRNLTATEDERIIEAINNAKPDFIWVGLGAPKQERWMAGHQGKVNGLMIGVGAGFDYVAGNIKRAPNWMQNHNMEWFYRLIQDPNRLLMRYWHTNLKFIWLVLIRGK